MVTDRTACSLVDPADTFIAAGRCGKHAAWRWAITIILTLCTASLYSSLGFWLLGRAFQTPDGRALWSDAVLGPMVRLFPAAATLPVFLVLFRIMHGRRPARLLGWSGRVDGGRLGQSAILYLGLLIVSEIVMHVIDPASRSLAYQPADFWPLLFLTVLLLPCQVGFEELFFRSYLLQGAAQWTARRWMAVALVSVLFMAMHLPSPEARAYGLLQACVVYAGLSATLATVTLVDGTVSAALGAHLAHNLYVLLLVGQPVSPAGSAALIVTTDHHPVQAMLRNLLVFCIYLLVMYRGSRRCRLRLQAGV
jgi:hypothetical protein